MAALLCVALAFVPLLGSRRQSVRLPSGEMLTLLGVTKGRKPFLYPHSPVSRLLSSLHLTNGVDLGPLHYPPIRSVNEFYGIYSQSQLLLSNSILMVLRHEGPTDDFQKIILAPWHPLARATLADENGEEWESGLDLSMGIVDLWGFIDFPRRGGELRLRVYDNSPEQGWRTVVEFKLPNPYRGDYPRWKATPLPIVAYTNELEASLISISFGLPTWVAEYQPQVWCTKFQLQLLENGKPSSQWWPRFFHAVDATGNEWTCHLDKDSEVGGVWQVSVSDRVFSPSEVWRMSFTFVRMEASESAALGVTSPYTDDLRTFDFLVQPPTNPPSFKTPFPASSK